MARKSLVLMQAETKIAGLEASLQAVNHRLGIANARVKELEDAMAAIPRTPVQVEATSVQVSTRECEKCKGTGLFKDQYMCYRCAGKGVQTESDARRNWGYDKAAREGHIAEPVLVAEFKVVNAEAKKLAQAGSRPRVVRRSQYEYALYA